MTHTVKWLAFIAVVAMLLSGCGGPTFSSLPLPGSGISGPTIKVTAEFGEALNLANGASVRVNGVDSGRVAKVAVHDFKAEVTMNIRTSAEVHQGATARLRYTTPLGELFVDLTNPSTGALLRDGASLPLSATSTAPTVEDSLASASLLINGGGLAQLQTITSEANNALGGREGTVRDLLNRSAYLLSQVNASSGDIDRTLTALNKVAIVLHQRRQTIHQALVDVRPASQVLRANLDNLTALLASLDRFGGTANSVVRATRKQILELVTKAGPILQELSSVRGVLPQTLAAIIALAKTVDEVTPGDYVNLGAHLRLDAVDLSGKMIDLSSLLSGGGLGGLLGGLGGGGLPNLGSLGASVSQGVAQDLLAGLTKGLNGTGGTKGASGTTGTKKPDAPKPGGLLGTLLGGLLGGAK